MTTVSSAEHTRRDFLYIATGAVGAVGAAAALVPLIARINPDASTVAAGAPVEIDLAPIAEGQIIKVFWRSKPIFIFHRTKKEIEEAQKVDVASLPDPEPNSARVKQGHDQWLVVIGICTHLGCIPLAHQGEYRRLVLPVPRLAIRHRRAYSQRAGAEESGFAALRIHHRHQDPDRLIRDGLFKGSIMSGHSTYQPTNGVLQWLEKRLPIGGLIHSSFIAYPTPRNLNYWWTFGGILSFMLGVQIITGIILAMHYTPHVDYAFKSVEVIMRDVNFGWLLALPARQRRRDVLPRGLYPHVPRHVLRLLQGAARGALDTRRRSLFADDGHRLHGLRAGLGADELLGGDRHHQSVLRHSRRRRHDRHLAVGRLAVGNPTLNRFYSLHYLLPFAIAGVVVLHVWALHVPPPHSSVKTTLVPALLKVAECQ